MTEKPIARWLRETRLRQTSETGDPWTQDRFLDELRAAGGWAPHRPNYSKYETGRATPERDTLARLERFWADRGEPGPDYTPPTEPTSDQARLAAAIDRQASAIELQAAAIQALAVRLDALTGETAGGLRDLSEAIGEMIGAGLAGRRGESGDDAHPAPAAQ